MKGDLAMKKAPISYQQLVERSTGAVAAWEANSRLPALWTPRRFHERRRVKETSRIIDQRERDVKRATLAQRIHRTDVRRKLDVTAAELIGVEGDVVGPG